MVAQTSDRIEKQITLRAPRSRVWRALTNAQDFGTWFGVVLENDFRPGASVSGRITIVGFENLAFNLDVERIEPEHYFAYRWHPYAIDPKVDYSQEPTTLVEFQLEEVKEGTKLTVTESGFDRIPLARRAEAFRMNSGGWEAQIKNIERYVSA
jgi:uncharacterized protein YndB with AHSA1/START domain